MVVAPGLVCGAAPYLFTSRKTPVMNTDDALATDKRNVWSAMHTIAESTPQTLAGRLAKIYHPDARWRGSHPWN